MYLQWLPLLAHYNQSSCCNEMPQKDQLQWAAHLYICPVSEIICKKILESQDQIHYLFIASLQFNVENFMFN